jgi:NAD(P)-dependent dehydrogenase (short-subunit alcohol dehydrogenase family)
MSTLARKIVVISGGTTGIGLAIAQRFVAEGAHVFIFGRRQAQLDEAVKLIGRNVTALQADAANLDDLDRVAAAVKAKKGVQSDARCCKTLPGLRRCGTTALTRLPTSRRPRLPPCVNHGGAMSDVVNISRAYEAIDKFWSPRVLGRVNDHYVKVAKLRGSLT